MRSAQVGVVLPHFVHFETRQKRVRHWFHLRSLGDQREQISVVSWPTVRFAMRGEEDGRASRSLVPPHHYDRRCLSRQATVNHAAMRSRVVAQIVRTTWPHLLGQTERRETSRLFHPTHICTFVSSGVDETALALLCRYVPSLARRPILHQHKRSTRRPLAVRADGPEYQSHVTRRGRQRLQDPRRLRSSSFSRPTPARGTRTFVNPTPGFTQEGKLHCPRFFSCPSLALGERTHPAANTMTCLAC